MSVPDTPFHHLATWGSLRLHPEWLSHLSLTNDHLILRDSTLCDHTWGWSCFWTHHTSRLHQRLPDLGPDEDRRPGGRQVSDGNSRASAESRGATQVSNKNSWIWESDTSFQHLLPVLMRRGARAGRDSPSFTAGIYYVSIMENSQRWRLSCSSAAHV